MAGRDTVLQHVGLQQAGKEPKKLAAKPEYKFADDPELSAIEVPAVRAGSIRSLVDRQSKCARADTSSFGAGCGGGESSTVPAASLAAWP